MKGRSSKIIFGLILAGAVIGLTFAYAFLKPTEKATAPISSIPIESTDKTNAQTNTNVDIDNSLAKFEIIQSESGVQFSLGEVLRGTDNLVVGRTDQVAAEIIVDFANPSASQIGIISINARTFKTDSSFRDRAIQNKILLTNTFEFISFAPTSITGWPETTAVGDTIDLKVTGNLTILDTTKEVVFNITLKIVSETRLEGNGSTTVAFADFGIVIPEVQAVTKVDDNVILEIFFVAERVG